jgi:hypothetical protein
LSLAFVESLHNIKRRSRGRGRLTQNRSKEYRRATPDSWAALSAISAFPTDKG